MRAVARFWRHRPSGARRLAPCTAAPLLVLAAAALARPVPVPLEPSVLELEPAPTAVTVQRSVSLDRAIELASRRFPGRVVRAETVARNGRRIHEIRILAEGEGDAQMRIVRIDAETGRFL